MDFTRRDFLKVSGVTAAGITLGTLGFDLSPIEAYARANPPIWADETLSICPYCGCGCGVIVGSKGGTMTYVEGDPENPINQGTLCSKGQASIQLRTVDGALNPRRITQPMVRRPGAAEWETISWEQAITEVAQRVKATRDAEIIAGDDVPINRLETVAALGSAKMTNEECYSFTKLMRALGITYIEHCARV